MNRNQSFKRAIESYHSRQVQASLGSVEVIFFDRTYRSGRENARTGTKAKFNNRYDHNRELEKETNVKVFDLKRNYGT